jgi:hypothetical protein
MVESSLVLLVLINCFPAKVRALKKLTVSLRTNFIEQLMVNETETPFPFDAAIAKKVVFMRNCILPFVHLEGFQTIDLILVIRNFLQIVFRRN